MSYISYEQILRILQCSDEEVCALFRCGSHVYGTASAISDEDFVLVWLAERKQDLLFRPKLNFVVYGSTAFQKAVDSNSIFALECFFTPPKHRLKEPSRSFHFRRNLQHLVDNAIEKSTSDFTKAARIFADDPNTAIKKIFHSIRVPKFAIQIARNGCITDFHEAIPVWEDLIHFDGVEWSEWLRFGAVRAACCQELKALVNV